MTRTPHHPRRMGRYALAVAMLAPVPAGAEVIFETADPFGGPFGLWGPDVCIDQSVGLRFTPGADYHLDRISLWFMSNDFSGRTHPLVEVTLRTDDDSVKGISVPSSEVLEAWSFNVSAVGWNPILEVMDSAKHPLLTEDVNYWIVAESMAPCGLDGVWNIASKGVGFMSFSLGYGDPWQPGGQSAVAATIIEGTPIGPCPADLDGDGSVGILDLLAVLAAWGSDPGGPPDFDGDGTVGILDLLTLLANWGPCV